MMNRETARKRAAQLVAQMTVDEKAAQLRYDAPAIERLGIPEYNWWSEALHGVARAGMATMFPQAIGMAAMFDDAFLERIGGIVATEGRAKFNAFRAHGDRNIYKGLTFWSPNVNIFRDPRWGRGHETYGEDPYLTSRMGVAYVKGLQGSSEHLKAAACAKHFAVHSGPEGVRHHFDAIASKKDMEETYLPAFEACVKEGEVEAVMGAYNRTNGEPCCGHTVLQEFLRTKWGFKGHFVSDCWAIRDFHENHKVTNSPKESAALALKKGTDVNCGNTYLHMLEAYDDGLVSEADITLACERLFTTRYLLGDLDGSEFDGIPYGVVECEDHLLAAETAAKKSAVLLKNDGVLPLSREKLTSIAVIGPNADSRIALIGNYHGTASRYITIQEGIQDAAQGDMRVYAAKGCELQVDRQENLSRRQDRLSEAVIVAEQSDVVVLVLGLDESLEGEQSDDGARITTGDKDDLDLPEVQRELLERVVAVGKPTVLVLTAGSSIDLRYAQEHVNAILLAWYPGARGGKAIAELLFGDASPSGKLPVTFYAGLEGLPEFEDYAMAGRTYRYMDYEPLYPFGFGLTYGDVRVTSAELAEDPVQGESVTVCATVTNAGSVDTEDVVQGYIKDEASPFAVPNPCLCAFKRVSLKAGETAQVLLDVAPLAFTVVDDAGNRSACSERFTLYVANSQPDAVSERLSGNKAIALEVNF